MGQERCEYFSILFAFLLCYVRGNANAPHRNGGGHDDRSHQDLLEGLETKLPAADADRLFDDLARLEALATATNFAAEAFAAGVAIKKLKGYGDLYRVRSGDWRMAVRLIGATVKAEWVRHRREAYD